MRLLLIEDQAMIRQGLSLLLRQLYPDIVIREGSVAKEGLALLEAENFDVILLDFYLPDASGRGMVQDFVQRSGAPVVILSGSNDPQDIAAAMKAGAKGYIVKSSKPATLHHVLELTLSGESFFPWEGAVGETPAARGPSETAERAAGEQPDLTDRQREILLLVAQGKSNKEIARALDILEGTVKAHLRFLMKHLNAKNRTQLAVMASKLS